MRFRLDLPSHAGEPPRRPRATVRRAGRRRDSGASGEGFRARPGVAPHCRPIRRRAPRRRPFLAFAASAARLRDPTREGSRGFRAAFTETDCETVSTHDRSQAPAERPWSMLNGSGSGRPPIRECEILDPGALEHETPRCQTRSTDYTTHGLPECQSNDASRVGPVCRAPPRPSQPQECRAPPGRRYRQTRSPARCRSLTCGKEARGRAIARASRAPHQFGPSLPLFPFPSESDSGDAGSCIAGSPVDAPAALSRSGSTSRGTPDEPSSARCRRSRGRERPTPATRFIPALFPSVVQFGPDRGQPD